MAYVRRELPTFSWSHRRDQTLAECQQQYFIRYYASHNGWERGASGEARQAYTLGKLVSLPQALGMALHRRAAECVAAVTAGDPLPDERTLLDRCRSELKRLYRCSRNRKAFLANPKASPMLHELYYGGTIAPEQFERTRAKLRACIANLARSAVWADLRQAIAAGGEVLVIDSLETFTLDDTVVYAAPDLVYREAAGGPWVVCDWKSSDEWDASTDQVALYSLLVRDGLGWSLVDGACRGRVVCLASGEDHQFALDADDLAEAERRVRTSIARMRTLLHDPVANRPLGWEAYPLNWRPWRCRHCNYLEVCRDRIMAEIRERAGDAA